MTTITSTPVNNLQNSDSVQKKFGNYAKYVPTLLVLATVLTPLLFLIFQSFHDDQTGWNFTQWVDTFKNSNTFNYIGQTLFLAFFATCGSIIFGVICGIILVFVPFPGSSLISKFLDGIISLPSFLITLALTFFYGGTGIITQFLSHIFGHTTILSNLLQSRFGVIFAMIICYTPYMIRSISTSLTSIPEDQIQVAASLGATPMLIIRKIILPATYSAILAGTSIVALLAINEFGIIMLMGIKNVSNLATSIYNIGIVEGNWGEAAVLAIIQIIISIIIYLILNTISRKINADS